MEMTWAVRLRHKMSLGNLSNNIYSIAHCLRRRTLETLVQEILNDIQFLDTQSTSALLFPRRMPKPRHGDQLIE